MPKRVKKGGGGGGKTEGERLLFLQQRAQAEEEMAKKKEEILTLYLKDKLQKEERNTAMNLMKINDGWRSILRQSRAAELRKDMEVLMPTFETQLDAMDDLIKNLVTALQEAERHSARVRRVHLQHLDRLLALQHRRLGLVQQQWEGGLQQLSSRFSSDRKQILEQSEQRTAHLEDVEFAMTMEEEDVTREIQTLFDAVIQSYKEAYPDTKASLQVNQRDELKEERRRLEKTKRDFEQLESKEDRLLDHQRHVQTVQKNKEEVKKTQETVVHLKKKLVSNEAKKQSMEQDLVAQRNLRGPKTHELQNQLVQTRAAARKKLTDLTMQSDAATKKLKAVIAKGEKVVRAGEMCEKMEDKVRLLLRPEELRQEPGADPQEPAEKPELLHLTRRVAAAALQREVLKRHKEDLSRENQQLKLLLRQHLDAETIGGQQLTIDPAPLSGSPLTTRTHITVIEGVHAMKHALRD